MRDRAYFKTLVATMKQALLHLEDVKLIRHDDPELTELKTELRGKIAEFESDAPFELQSRGAD
jgi:hypothetical protein